MTSISITSIAGLSTPINVYVCNVFGNYCVLVATVNGVVPPSFTINLPPEFETAPAVGIKIVACNGCEDFKIFYCEDPNKQFQDLEEFYFMDSQQYDFQS